ncbi:non-hydrolyzing UDP-N-acetylglucosamine 2-epimerase [Catenuloplanes indicus]|uniref:UDP-N-acetylglucosamine 2-epimerase (Non-hydrolyzing) n=1 Tax=Catenuloplanes indicus TaxID=137267 RepID=A0AAE4AXD4_9ACTN|nr:UDP-N-acetylglucosamine 2-epimerase (non-hydrolyzing) [Catenuloplanes indicus]MDQ0366064.1 UDP-N-acetylglucosamine 2-epimerase (non-hydrolyzing) [Catenuloplanes indicus]
MTAVAVVFGTRPEIIKLGPVIAALGAAARPVFTGQHYDAALVDTFLAVAGVPDLKPALPGIGGTGRADQVSLMLSGLTALWRADRPDAVVVQGDTNTANAAAQAAHYLGIPVVHVEAGLRSFDRNMPEEINRLVISAVADVHCAATEENAEFLLRAGTPAESVHLTGNPIVEATRAILPSEFARRRALADAGVTGPDFVLATIHRPENADDPDRLALILAQLALLGRPVVLPLHPRTRQTISRYEVPVPPQITVTDPLDHARFLALATACTLVVSDSGGVQEEVTVIGRPLVVVRNSTERPEAMRAGFALLAQPAEILDAARRLLDPAHLARLAHTPSPFGDGHAAERIAALTLAAIHHTPAAAEPPVPVLRAA